MIVNKGKERTVPFPEMKKSLHKKLRSFCKKETFPKNVYYMSCTKPFFPEMFIEVYSQKKPCVLT